MYARDVIARWFVRRPKIGLAGLACLVLPWAVVALLQIRLFMLPILPVHSARDARSIADLRQALIDYRQRYGEFPPDFTTGNPEKEINDHLAKIFPFRVPEADMPKGVEKLGPHNALVFWLRGFYPDQRCPLTGNRILGFQPGTNKPIWVSGDFGEILAEVYDGDERAFLTSRGMIEGNGNADSLIDELFESKLDQFLRYKDSNKRAIRYRFNSIQVDSLEILDRYSTPLVYFRGDRYPTACYATESHGIAQPYRLDQHNYFAATQFQILSAGSDQQFGRRSIYANDAANFPLQSDNLTSFSNTPLGYTRLSHEIQRAKRLRNLSPCLVLVCMYIYGFIRWASRPSNPGWLSLLVQRQLRDSAPSATWADVLDRQKRERRSLLVERLKD